MSGIPPEAQEPLATLQAFLETPDWDSARRFADTHLELCDPDAVALLVETASQAAGNHEHDHALYYLAYAGLLCGRDWPDGPAVVAAVGISRAAVEASPFDPTVLDEAIQAARRVLDADIARVAHPALLPRLLDTASLILAHAYGATRNRDLLDQATAAQRRAVDTTPPTSTDLPGRLNNLALWLGDLYTATGERGLLDEAVQTQRRAVDTTPPTSTDLPGRLNNLALRLGDLYAATGERGLLDEAVQTQRRAVDTTPPTSTDLPGRLNNLANRLAGLYAATGERGLLDEAVQTQRRAVDTTPPTSTDLPGRLNNLAAHLAGLYAATGNRDLLDEAAAAQRRAVDTTPPTSADLPGELNNLAFCLADLYAATGERGLLDEAVQTQRRAVDTTPAASTDLPGRLNNLANRLSDLYAATGERGLLDEAVQTQRRAVDITPPTSTEHPGHLNNLANHLADLYAATGNRDLLDQAAAAQRQAVDTTPPASTDLPRRLSNLANHLVSLYAATGERGLLDEAVQTQRRAVDITPSTSTELPRHLNNLASHLASLHAATATQGERGLLDEAVQTQRRAVDTTPSTSTELPRRLSNLANCLASLHAATAAQGERGLLDEAVQTQRRAVDITPSTSTEHPGQLNDLAVRLADQYAATGNRDLLDEAWRLVEGLAGGGPWERAVLAGTRAGLVRQDERGSDRYRVAARELTAALEAFETEFRRPGLDLVRRRDLAQRLDGLLGDLATSHQLGGDVDRAVGLIEGDRMWLTAPQGQAPGPPEPSVPVAWVSASQWETTIITTVDHQTFTPHVVGRTRPEIHNAVLAVLDAARMSDDGAAETRPRAVEARRRTVDALCELATDIVTALPPAERLLVVPLGICALLPYAAARHDGEHLIDHTIVTLAPSLASARAACRPRPGGPSVGAFHPGKGDNRPLDLAEDRRAFEELVSRDVIDRPTAELLLAHLVPGVDIGHLSCHGAYNALAPLESWLDLETRLTIQAVLNHTAAPWLVNLSACETAIPDLQAAEQLISFPTGFLLGGAAHVLATLWPVDNRYATAVNRDMYLQLAAGAHPAAALRHAIQRLRGTPNVSSTSGSRSLAAASDQPAEPDTHPYWWAPFTHYGSPW